MDNENRTSLAETLRRRNSQPLPPGESLIYMKSIVASLEGVHGRGLVHGDLRAQTVMVDSQGRAYLEGVGFAQHIGSRSVVRAPLESAPHLAPELISYQEVTEAADVFSLGVLLFEMLTGEMPSGRKGELRSPAQLNPAVPQALSQAVMRAMSPNPAERFSKPRAFFEAACSSLNTSPDQVPDRLAATTLHVGAAATIQAPETVAVQPYPQGQETLVVARETQAVPVEPDYTSQPAESGGRRPVWIWIGVALLGFISLLCVGFLVGSRIPDWIASLNASSTPTWTATLLVSDTPQPSATAVEIITLPPPPIATETLPPTLPPTMEPTLTFTSPPPPTEPPASNTGDLQVRNRFPYGIYVFRERTNLNTSPIPPGMYLIFFNQPAGTHLYRFCRDLQMNDCLEKQVEINGDVEITVP